MKLSSLGTDSEAVCLMVSVDRIQLLVHAVLFMGAVGLTFWSDAVANIWHPLLHWRACILIVDGQDVQRVVCCGIHRATRGTYFFLIQGGDGVP